jgi:hypothetical protein
MREMIEQYGDVIIVLLGAYATLAFLCHSIGLYSNELMQLISGITAR